MKFSTHLIHRHTLPLLLLLVVQVQVFSVQANERAYQWQGSPIPITVSLHEEIILDFGEDIKVGVPATISQVANIDSLSGKLYITASAAFDTQRLQVARLSDGQRLLIDLTAIDAPMANIDTHPLIDVHFDALDANLAKSEGTLNTLNALESRTQMPTPALLTRFAYQTLYSPSHAIEPLPGVQRSAMKLDTNIADSAFPLWAVDATPVAAWSLHGFTVTAITLRHLNHHTFELDPRHMAIDAYSVAFAFPDIGPAGLDSAINAVFVVTKGPLHQFLPAVTPVLPGGQNERS